MRYIQKRIVKAKSYQKWHEDIGSKRHPKYVSSSFRYYYDIVYDLLVCQRGLCAYTERFLVNVQDLSTIRWNDGQCSSFRFSGQLDHYDPTLKESRGWDWDNFFIVDTDVNTKSKRSLSPNRILKPDIKGFDANRYLQYILSEHIFIPKTSLTDDEKEKVKWDLFVLGVNFEPIVQLRRKYLQCYVERLRYLQQSVEDIRSELFQFHTAFEFIGDEVN